MGSEGKPVNSVLSSYAIKRHQTRLERFFDATLSAKSPQKSHAIQRGKFGKRSLPLLLPLFRS
jgi:hypothetical protein